MNPARTSLKLRFREQRTESKECRIFVFDPLEKFSFTPGQFLKWRLPHANADERGETRFFTISSSPTEGEVWITTRVNTERSSSFKKALLSLKQGDVLEADNPRGSFTLPEPVVPTIFIAGGIGITPFRSMLKYLEDTKKPADITLFYSNRTANDIPFKQFLDLSPAGVRVVYSITDDIPNDWKGETGFIDLGMIEKYAPDYKNRQIYISGPEPMVEAFEKLLADAGTSTEKIHTDFFPGYTETYQKPK